MEENATAKVFVQAKGRNIRPSWASSKKTGRKETRMMRREKKIAGPTCFAAPMRIKRLCFSLTEMLDWPFSEVPYSDKWR